MLKRRLNILKSFTTFTPCFVKQLSKAGIAVLFSMLDTRTQTHGSHWTNGWRSQHAGKQPRWSLSFSCFVSLFFFNLTFRKPLGPSLLVSVRHPLMVTFSRANINSGSPKMEIGKTTRMESIRQPSWGASGVDQTFSVHSQWCLINSISEWAGWLLQRCRCGPGHSSQVSPLAMACCVFV